MLRVSLCSWRAGAVVLLWIMFLEAKREKRGGVRIHVYNEEVSFTYHQNCQLVAAGQCLWRHIWKGVLDCFDHMWNALSKRVMCLCVRVWLFRVRFMKAKICGRCALIIGHGALTTVMRSMSPILWF